MEATPSSYVLADDWAATWRPIPGDMVNVGNATVEAQWPPDGMLKWHGGRRPVTPGLEFAKLSKEPFLVVVVIVDIPTYEDMWILQSGRFWWIRRRIMQV